MWAVSSHPLEEDTLIWQASGIGSENQLPTTSLVHHCLSYWKESGGNQGNSKNCLEKFVSLKDLYFFNKLILIPVLPSFTKGEERDMTSSSWIHPALRFLSKYYLQFSQQLPETEIAENNYFCFSNSKPTTVCGSVTYGGGGTILYLAAHNGIRYLFLNIQKLYTSCSGDLTQFHAAATCIKLYYVFLLLF